MSVSRVLWIKLLSVTDQVHIYVFEHASMDNRVHSIIHMLGTIIIDMSYYDVTPCGSQFFMLCIEPSLMQSNEEGIHLGPI